SPCAVLAWRRLLHQRLASQWTRAARPRVDRQFINISVGGNTHHCNGGWFSGRANTMALSQSGRAVFAGLWLVLAPAGVFAQEPPPGFRWYVLDELNRASFDIEDP